MTIRQFDYHYVITPAGQAETARIVNALCDKELNLLALSSFPQCEGQQLDLISDDADRLSEILEGMGLKVSQRRSGFLIQNAAGPCAIASVLDTLAQANIPVVATQAIAGAAGQADALLWVEPEHLEKAAGLIGATRKPDRVDEASEESFPASDAPSFVF